MLTVDLTVDVGDCGVVNDGCEVGGGSREVAFRKHLEEIHTLWTQFEKKRDKIVTLLRDTQRLVYRS
ncbi:hypothetical protein Tco_1451494 [Tanacetum coccineum]